MLTVSKTVTNFMEDIVPLVLNKEMNTIVVSLWKYSSQGLRWTDGDESCDFKESLINRVFVKYKMKGKVILPFVFQDNKPVILHRS